MRATVVFFVFTAALIALAPVVPAQPLEPASCFAYGGVIVEVRGSDFPAQPTVTFGGTPAEVVSATAERIRVVAPPRPPVPGMSSERVTVVVSGGVVPRTYPEAFTYVASTVGPEGAVTAFTFDPAAPATQTVVTPEGTAQLTIPVASRAMTVPGLVAGLVQVGAAPATLETDEIAAGTPIVGAADFSVHFFEDPGAARPDTPGASVYAPITDWSYDPGGAGPQMTLALDATGTLSAGEVRAGTTLWAARTTVDPVTRIATFDGPPFTRYQSTVLRSEVVDGLPASDAAPAGAVLVRFFETGAFSLRTGALPPPSVAAGVRIDTEPGTLSAPASGGTVVPLTALAGGLAWVDRVELRTMDGAVQASADSANFAAPAGTTESALSFTLPPTGCDGVLDVVVFLAAAPDTPFVTLQRVLQTTGAGTPCGAAGGGCPAGTTRDLGGDAARTLIISLVAGVLARWALRRRQPASHTPSVASTANTAP